MNQKCVCIYIYIYHTWTSQFGCLTWFRFRLSIRHPFGFNWHPLGGACTWMTCVSGPCGPWLNVSYFFGGDGSIHGHFQFIPLLKYPKKDPKHPKHREWMTLAHVSLLHAFMAGQPTPSGLIKGLLTIGFPTLRPYF